MHKKQQWWEEKEEGEDVLEKRVNHGIALSSERSRGRPEEEARS
jgi:hypothetical protein